MRNKPVTCYVTEPKDQPCKQVNPHLWQEFCARNLHLFENAEYYTEAYCVQWLDLNYYQQKQDYVHD